MRKTSGGSPKDYRLEYLSVQAELTEVVLAWRKLRDKKSTEDEFHAFMESNFGRAMD